MADGPRTAHGNALPIVKRLRLAVSPRRRPDGATAPRYVREAIARRRLRDGRPQQIKLRAENLMKGRKVNKMTVRNFLGYFGAERRGAVRVEAIQKILDSLGLDTEPNFQSAWMTGTFRYA